MADPAAPPEKKIEAGELERAIQRCLDDLPMDFRTVVVLTDVQGFDYAEVAAATQVPLGTVKSRLARARMRLRECLQGGELLRSAFRLRADEMA
jgi:RNA polymerase sigma-70 factor (ECF subfamily)